MVYRDTFSTPVKVKKVTVYTEEALPEEEFSLCRCVKDKAMMECRAVGMQEGGVPTRFGQ